MVDRIVVLTSLYTSFACPLVSPRQSSSAVYNMLAAFIQTPLRVAGRLLPSEFALWCRGGIRASMTHSTLPHPPSFFSVATWGPSLVIFAGWMIYPALDNGFKHSVSTLCTLGGQCEDSPSQTLLRATPT